MIIILVLGFFLVLSGIVIEGFFSVRQTEAIARKFYLKQQAYYQAVSTLEFVCFYFRKDDASYDSLNDMWAYPIEVPTPEGRIKIQIEDEERYLNLNLARTEQGLHIVKRLFEELRITSLSPEILAVWVGNQGFWDREYPPKKAPLDSLEELFFLGISHKDFYGKTENSVFYKGLSMVATVWSNGKVNLNTAPPEVIMALSPKLDRTLVERLIEYRQYRPLKKLEDLILIDGFTFKILHDLRPWATVKSENFKVTIQVKIGEVEGELVSIIKRTNYGFKVVYWRFS